MPKYLILLSISGSSRFTLEAEMLDEGSSTPEKEDHVYELVATEEVK
jgi:hypothetical protein